ncbi:hypothetical protein I315_06164 [Cryptococcus gattii Ru294]|nr:hypothetical protein I315_06875 [Cryptococcus gattii Ru294]KIR51465.1 hypothetical protein I315_06164 [Cryptococcus gattii Ru294]
MGKSKRSEEREGKRSGKKQKKSDKGKEREDSNSSRSQRTDDRSPSPANEHLLTPLRALSQTEEESSTSQFPTSDLYASSLSSDEDVRSRFSSSTTGL